MIIHEGKKYKVETQIIQHGTIWKVWQGTQAIFLSILSLGIGLAFQAWRDAIKNKWHNATTGEETKCFYKRIRESPPEIQTTNKASKLGTTLHPSKESTKETPMKLTVRVRNLLDEARKDPTRISIHDLEIGLEEALNVGAVITNPDDKTTIFAISETVARHYISITKDFDKATELRMKTALAISPAPPLSKLSDALKMEHPKLGLRLQPIDTSLFKNQTLAVQKRTYTDGKTRLHLDAKINHSTREGLQSTLEWIVANPKNLFDALPKGFCTGVSVTNETVSFEGREDKLGKKWAGDFSSDLAKTGYKLLPYYEDKVIHFEGIGRIKIGNDPKCHTEYNRISIDLDPHISEEEAAEKLNIIFATIGLGAVSSSPREDDIERIKIMQLFRAYYPKEAYGYERFASTFQGSVENLKANIAITVPDMKDKFKEFLEDHPERMYQQEVYPGQHIWAIQGLANEVRKAGGLGLLHGVHGDTFDDSIDRLISMLKTGSLSTQDRFQAGIIAQGTSCEEDLKTGGAESVFTRLVTEDMSKNPMSYPLHGKIQILCDLDLVERVGFVYTSDQYGTKEVVTYVDRPSILGLTEYCQNNPSTSKNNEVCIRNRVPPERMKGVMVKNDGEKDALVNALRLEGLLTLDTLTRECINGVPIDQFIHVGALKAEYWV